MECVTKTAIALLLCAPMLAQQNAPPPDSIPQADISNGSIHAKIYLPDTERGYYRGSRFDWSGVVASLEYKGHNFFGVWFPRYDPKLNDAITGPVEEFRTGDSSPGFAEAKPGETFLKIGVGTLRKPDNKEYSFFRGYDIVDNGKWTVKAGKDQVKFTQVLRGPQGYAYVYTKTVRLAKDKPQLIVEHTLRNTGKRDLSTSVYDHDFFMLDKQTTGPDFTVKFGFIPHSTADFRSLAELQGDKLAYKAELQPRQSVAGSIEGFNGDASQNDTRVENAKAGIGVHEVGNRPIEKLYFWSIPTTVCPEIYIHMDIKPGHDFHWQIAYEFYTLDGPSK